jgi:phosphoglycerol transferase MdoB-like AlkP superfamily enzyme
MQKENLAAGYISILLLTLVYSILNMYSQTGHSLFNCFLFIVSTNYFTLSLIFGLLLLAGRVQASAARLSINAVVFLLTLVFITDFFALTSINARFEVSDVIHYAGNLSEALSFMSPGKIMILLVLVFSPFFRLRVEKWKRVSWIYGGLAAFFIFSRIISHAAVKNDVGNDVTLLFLEKAKSRIVTRNPSRDRLLYEAPEYAHAQPRLINLNYLKKDHPNILLVFVESFSSIDSKKISGLYDNLPKFDRLCEKGRLFVNSLATYEDTEGSKIALLTAQPIIPYPGCNRFLYNSFWNTDTVPRAFARIGYDTEYVTTGPLEFLNQGDYLRHIGFNTVVGRGEVKRFREAKKYTFGCPSDEVLYDEIIDRIKNRGENAPFFMMGMTVSGHRPYLDPEGIANTRERVTRYVDEKLFDLYQRLDEIQFFKNSILIITGDHRAMFPPLEGECEKFPNIYKMRVPTLIIGKNVGQNIIDERLVSHPNLMENIYTLAYSDRKITDGVIYVERYTSGYCELTGKLTYVDQNGCYKFTVAGDEILWDSGRPDYYRRIEKIIHIQRAVCQRWANRAGSIKIGEIVKSQAISEKPEIIQE